MDYKKESPDILRDFLSYHETIRGHSKITVDEYFLDLRMFFRFLKLQRGLVSDEIEFNEISIKDIDLALLGSVKMTDVYEFLAFLARERPNKPNSRQTGYGLNAKSRARKISTLRSFYKYLTLKAKVLSENPIADIDSPKLPQTLPRYLTLDDSRTLLSAVGGVNSERDYCILIVFLSCGLRISELIGLNLHDISNDALRIRGKGNKERIVFLNNACAAAIADYLEVRSLQKPQPKSENALFLSRNGNRISRTAVHTLVKKRLLEAGLDRSSYSSHKLRHTAATLMLQSGVDVRTLQELLGHEHLNTTQIYTHIENESLREAAERSPLSDFKKDNDS